MTDTLNNLLIECAGLRHCYPLMHRTLHEFNWFVTSCIFGWTSYSQYEMDQHVTEYPEGFSAMCDLRDEVREIHKRWNHVYSPDADELPRLAEAFLEYWKEKDEKYTKEGLYDEVL